MPVLSKYAHFAGSHWETASLRNALAYQGIRVPQTGEPISEAILFGISGGIAVGYFSFAYEGHDPHVALLTRNTFDPFDKICERLGIEQHIRQTTDPAKATKNLLRSLEEGRPPLVWADSMSLPYGAGDLDDESGMWLMEPIIVYGYDETADKVHIADRASVGLSCTLAELEKARGRVKDNKYKLMTIEDITLDKLPGAILKGIHDCISLFTEKPPKGARHNFGFAALQYWADLLVKKTNKQSWAKVFPAGRPFYNALVTAYNWIELFGSGGKASRPLYAEFLRAAAVILNRPTLGEVAALFDASAEKWATVGRTLLPDSVSEFKETRDLMLRRHASFREKGMESVAEVRSISAQLKAIRAGMADGFPLTDAEIDQHCAAIREAVLAIHDRERIAVDALESAVR